MPHVDPQTRLASLERAMKALEDTVGRFIALGLTKKGAIRQAGRLLNLEFTDDDFAPDIEGSPAKHGNKHIRAV